MKTQPKAKTKTKLQQLAMSNEQLAMKKGPGAGDRGSGKTRKSFGLGFIRLRKTISN